MKLFGFPIATPCETISRDMNGTLIIKPKVGPQIDAWCCDYLWTNRGSESEAGSGDKTSAIKNTYTSIGQRFSGLRNSEGTPDSRKTHPFALCQRSGSMAPIKSDGKINESAVTYAKTLGSISQIQAYYNSIYNAANNANSGSAQSTAVNQCYGLNRRS
jgi:hypothetical protein